MLHLVLNYLLQVAVPFVITAHQAGYYMNDWYALVNFVDAALTKWAYKSRSN